MRIWLLRSLINFHLPVQDLRVGVQVGELLEERRQQRFRGLKLGRLLGLVPHNLQLVQQDRGGLQVQLGGLGEREGGRGSVEGWLLKRFFNVYIS